jgi:hypothetical protein
MSEDRQRVAEELRRIREAVRDQALVERRPDDVLGPAPAVRTSEPASPGPATDPAPDISRPDGSEVNARWDVGRAPHPRGLRGLLTRLVRRLVAPVVDAQVSFNSRQVQLDNEILAYIDARGAATHQHYDAILGIYGRHLQDVDKRHLILQEEIVAHVHDLVERIDLVLSVSERSRLSLEFALRDLRVRVSRLESGLASAAPPSGRAATD